MSLNWVERNCIAFVTIAEVNSRSIGTALHLVSKLGSACFDCLHGCDERDPGEFNVTRKWRGELQRVEGTGSDGSADNRWGISAVPLSRIERRILKRGRALLRGSCLNARRDLVLLEEYGNLSTLPVAAFAAPISRSV